MDAMTRTGRRRTTLVRMAKNSSVQDWLRTTPAAVQILRRYVPGEHIEDALVAVRDLVAKGLWAAIDPMSEDVADRQRAEANASQAAAALQRLGDEGVAGECGLSVKLSALGSRLPEIGTAVAGDLVAEICAVAARVGTSVTIDMEDYTTTEDTLVTAATLRRDFPDLAVTVQSALRRTEADCRDLAGAGVRVRLCKGAYLAPASEAYQTKREVDRSYVRCLRTLMSGQGYPMVATHDQRIIEITGALAERHGRGVETFEYQMYFGIRPLEQRRLVDVGQQVRVVVPYGPDWYRYFMRRLAERPANIAFLLRSLARR